MRSRIAFNLCSKGVLVSDIADHYSRTKLVSHKYEKRPCGKRHSLRLRCVKCVEMREKAGSERKINEINPDFREWVYNRDGNMCVVPGCGATQDLTVDHRTPVVHGGKTDPDNLQTLCLSCNTSKGSKTWEDFLEQRSSRLGIQTQPI